MAKYFKYKSLDQLVADAGEMGHALDAQTDLTPLWAPSTVRDRSVGNRLCVQPMEGCDGTTDGRPDELTYRRYERFGAGGAKLIWGEATAVDLDARMNPRQLTISPSTQSDLARMLEGCRRAHREAGESADDLLLGLQLTHSGRYSFRRPQIVMHDPLLDGRTVDKSTGRTLDGSFPILSDGDLERIEDQYVEAARMAHAIGCDFVDLKQCHRYLLSELLAARLRPGRYGGPLENRTRLIRNIVRRIREECPRLIIATRVNVFDGVPFAASADDRAGCPSPTPLPVETAFGVSAERPTEEDLNEPLAVVRGLVEWGVDLINVTAGNPYASPHYVRPAEQPPVDGYEAPEHPLLGVLRHLRLTAAVQGAAGAVPVVGSGYSWLQEFAFNVGASQVAQGRTSFVGLGRGTLSQPDFARQLKEHGRLNRKTICRTFSYCTTLMRTKDHPLGQYPAGCPPFDKEAYGGVWKEVEALRAAPKATPASGADGTRSGG